MLTTTVVYDSLTGAYDRSIMGPHIQQVLDNCLSEGSTFSLLILDLDYFKSINDAFGHQRGDEVLKEFVHRVKSVVRSQDEIFRYGGDEFILLLPSSGKNQAIQVAGRIQKVLASAPVEGPHPITLSASIGLATYPQDAQTPEGLFEVIDRRLYLGKANERGGLVYQDHEATGELRSPIRPPDRVIEREFAFQQVRHFFQQLNEQRRGVVSVQGPGGSGRSRILAEIGKIARLQGFVVWHEKGTDALRSRQFGALAQMQQANGWPKVSTHPSSLGSALKSWIYHKKLAGLLVLLDDVEGIDPASLETLMALSGIGLPFPVGIVFSGEPSTSLATFYAETPLQVHINTEPLTERGIQVWLRHSLRWEAPQFFAAWLFQQTGGLPARVAEGLSWLTSQGVLRVEKDGWVVSEVSDQIHLATEIARGERFPDRLPQRLPDFLGREEEVFQLKNLIAARPLMTLCGPDGTGKTRLALQVASEVRGQYPDGVIWVGSGDQPAGVGLLATLAEWFGIHPREEESLVDALIDYLRGKRLLLVLDDLNLRDDHAMNAASFFHRVIEEAGQVRVLITTVFPPGLPDEAVMALRGFPLPEDLAPSEVVDNAAVQFFLHNARQVRIDFTPEPEDLTDILKICRLVEGLPLGIEMAAAWVSSYTCREIAEQIEQNRGFLRQSPQKEASQGDESLFALFDSFWQLYSPIEKSELMALAVLEGGFDRQAAYAVAGASPFFLDALAAKKILRSVMPQRYAMHFLLAQFSLNRLSEAPEMETLVRQRHCEYYLGLCVGGLPGLNQEVQQSLSLDLANFRHAWLQAVRDGSLDLLEASAEGLFKLYRNLARFREGIDLMQQALILLGEDLGEKNHRLAFLLRSLQGEFYYHIGQYPPGILVLETALEQLGELNFAEEKAETMRLLANLFIMIGQYDRASALLQQAREIAEPLDKYDLKYSILNRLGVASYFKKNYADAGAYFQSALVPARLSEKPDNVAVCLNNIGNIAMVMKDFERGRELMLESLEICIPQGMTTLRGHVLDSLASLGVASQNWSEGAYYVSQALRLLQDLDATPLMLDVLSKAAEILHHHGHDAHALNLLKVITQHSACPHDVRVRVKDLMNELQAGEEDEAVDRWQPSQLRRVVLDVLELLGC